MEFCPQCTTILNIEKGSISQQGGKSTDNIGEIIDLIKNNNFNLNNVNIKLNKILKSSEYNELLSCSIEPDSMTTIGAQFPL